MFPQQAGGRKYFLRVHKILKHGFFTTGVNKLVSLWQKYVDCNGFYVFELSYNDLKFMVWNSNYFCTSLLYLPEPLTFWDGPYSVGCVSSEATLTFWNGSCSACGRYLSVYFTITWSWILSCMKPRTLRLVACSMNSPETWDVTILSCPYIPATPLQRKGRK